MLYTELDVIDFRITLHMTAVNLIPDRSCWALVLLLYFGYFLIKRERGL
jgi:hypothetical protein